MADNTIPPGVSQLVNQGPPRTRNAAAQQPGPLETFQPGVQPSGIMKPPVQYDPPVESRAGGVGKGVMIGVALTLAGVAAVAVGPHLLDPTPPPLQMDQLTSQQRGALRDLNSLAEISAKYGGGLEREGILFNRSATPERALQEMMGGEPVYYVHAKGSTPLRIDNFQQLDRLQSHVQREEVKRQIKEGLDQISGGLREAGEAIGRELEDFWKEVQR